MRIFARKQKPTHQTWYVEPTKYGRPLSGQGRDPHSIYSLQHAIGNQAVQRLLHSKSEDLEASRPARNASPRLSHHFSQISMYSSGHGNIRPKLKVNAQSATGRSPSGRFKSALVLGNAKHKIQRTPVEVGDLPDCCVDGLRRIEAILSTFNAVEIVLSIAPSLTTPRPRGITSVMAALWNLAKAGVSFARNRQQLHEALDQIARSRVRRVIESMILQHAGIGRTRNPELEQHWRRMLEAF